VNADFSSVGLPKYVFLEMLDIIFNPKKTVGRLRRLIQNRRSKESAALAPSETKERSTSH
jgi:hypothetical protein